MATAVPNLRDEQVLRTRERILDGLVRTMAKGIAGLSIPAVARAANVSVPTVYRHFPTKARLLAALPDYLNQKSGLLEFDPTAGIADTIRQIYQKVAGLDDMMRAALTSEVAGQLRRRTMPERMARFRSLVRRRHPELPSGDVERLTRLLVILTSSAVIRAFRDYVDRPAGPASEDVVWALELIERGLARQTSRPAR